MIDEIVKLLIKMPLVLRTLAVGLIPALLTALGTVPILLGIRLGRRSLNAGMGFAAGVMLVASFTSLLIPAIEKGGIGAAILGFVMGVTIIKLLDLLIPHEHPLNEPKEDKTLVSLKRAQLMALAMIIHNIPEGMAVGAVTVYNVTDGLAIALAIGLQDMPEGLAVAIPILMITGRTGLSFAIGALSGIAEMLAASLPALMITYTHMTLPLVLALASGAMIYVVIHEIVPEIYSHGQDESVTIGFFAGFLVMLFLDSLTA